MLSSWTISFLRICFLYLHSPSSCRYNCLPSRALAWDLIWSRRKSVSCGFSTLPSIPLSCKERDKRKGAALWNNLWPPLRRSQFSILYVLSLPTVLCDCCGRAGQFQFLCGDCGERNLEIRQSRKFHLTVWAERVYPSRTHAHKYPHHTGTNTSTHKQAWNSVFGLC